MANIMNIDVIEKDCNALNMLFQTIINDMKNSPPVWEDFICKTTKLHTQLKSTICASTAFLESFQKIADLATNTKGITKDIGASLTRLCIRHKAIEAKFKQLTCSLNESLVQPLNDKLEEWKKTIINLDKDHNKEYKKVRGELKKKATDTMRLHKKLTKKQSASQDQQSSTHQTTTSSSTYYIKSNDLQYKYDTCLQETHNYYALLEETEKQHLRIAMIEQRNHFCTFFKLLKPIIDTEISMLNEANNMEEIINNLCKHTNDTTLMSNNSSTSIFQLEQTIKDLKGSPDFLSTITQNNTNLNLNANSPPSSPSSLGSRKSSVCSINSLTSSSSSSSHSRSPGHLKFRMQQQLICGHGGINRLSSVSSQDSGFTSQEQFYLKSPHLLDDKDSNEYKIAMACGTIKAWSKNAIANGSNGVNGGINGSNGSNSSLTQTTNQQITTVQQTSSSTIVDCSLLTRHTVAGLPLLNGNESSSSHKTRPALSIHTFDPPDHVSTTTTNGHCINANGHHELQQQQQQPSTSSPVIRSNSVRIDPTNQQPQHQQHYDSPSKLITNNSHQLSSPCNNNRLNCNNTNNNQTPPPPTTTTPNSNNNHHQIINNCNQNKNRQRSTTLPPEAIAEGMKELMKTNKNIMNPSPSKLHTTNSTLSTLSGTGSSDTLLEEDASFECFSNNSQSHDNRHRYSVDRITIPSTNNNNNNNYVYNEFNLLSSTTTTTTSLSSPSSSSTHSSTNNYNYAAFSSSNNNSASIPVKTTKPQPPIRRNSSISSNSTSINQKNFIISQQQQHQIQLQYQQENNYDDLHHIQKYNKLLNEQKQQQQQQQQLQQLATIPPSPPPPPPPPPPPLPINGFNNTTKSHSSNNSSNSNNYDDLPPPPDSFYSDDTPFNNNNNRNNNNGNGFIIKQESTTVIKQQQQKPQNNQVSVHQVLMSQIQFGVKLKPTNRLK